MNAYWASVIGALFLIFMIITKESHAQDDWIDPIEDIEADYPNEYPEIDPSRRTESSTRIRDTTYHSDYTTDTQIGPRSYGSDGVVCTQVRNTQYCN
jgi:hypothetical protein